MVLLYGHRGARGEVPENTLPSFRHCLASGVNRCELDLHLSSDGELIVIHDPTLNRTTGIRGSVSRYTAARLTTMDARLNGPAYPEPCLIPSLHTLFEHCSFEHWQLEVKSSSRQQIPRIIEAIQRLAGEFRLADRVTITSGSRAVLKTAQQMAPEISRGLVAEHRLPDPIGSALRYGCTLLALDRRLCTPGRIARAHRHNLHVSVWTVNDPEEMIRISAMGVDSLISDFPGRALETMQQRQD